MDITTLIFVAIGLSMDAFAVAIASGFVMKKLKVKHAFMIALYFGGFQGIMPIIGWLAGRSFKGFVTSVDHWVAFILLSIIGGKMIYEAFKIEEAEEKLDYYKHTVLLGLAIATSIDALAVGISFSFLNTSLFQPAMIIGVITFIFSFIGVYIGKRFGHFFEKKIEIAGGIILIGIGLKVLLDHIL